jgi:hypothetical protein
MASDTFTLVFRVVSEYIVVVLSHWVCGTLIEQSEETILPESNWNTPIMAHRSLRL